MSENPLFRKAALDKLASPERLDVLMRVTSPMGWLALTTVGGILVGVIVWSILGSIPERIDGQGVLLRGGANKEIRSTGSGRCPALNLKATRSISVGEVLGTITAAGKNEEVNVARTKVQQLENQRLTTEWTPARTSRRGTERRSPGCAATSTSSASTCSGPRPKWRASSRCSRTAGSRPSGWKARAARSAQRSRRSPASRARSRPRKTASARRGSGGAGLDTQIQIASAELRAGRGPGRLAGIADQHRRRPGHRSAQDGRGHGGPERRRGRARGRHRERPGRRLRRRRRRQAHQGRHDTEVSPSQVKREEYGFMLAEVSDLGEFIASREAVMSRMRNEADHQEADGPQRRHRGPGRPQAGRDHERLRLVDVRRPPFKIGGGTLVSINIVVDRKAPITMVMPFLRKMFGVSLSPVRTSPRDEPCRTTPSSRLKSPRPSRRRRASASRRRPSCRWRRSSAARRRSP